MFRVSTRAVNSFVKRSYFHHYEAHTWSALKGVTCNSRLRLELDQRLNFIKFKLLKPVEWHPVPDYRRPLWFNFKLKSLSLKGLTLRIISLSFKGLKSYLRLSLKVCKARLVVLLQQYDVSLSIQDFCRNLKSKSIDLRRTAVIIRRKPLFKH
jgi:hypothetical protein